MGIWVGILATLSLSTTFDFVVDVLHLGGWLPSVGFLVTFVGLSFCRNGDV